MLHGADLIVNGKTVEQFQPNINAYINFKLLSQMSSDDHATLGTTLGMGECLDNTQSMKFNPTTTAAGGNAQTATTVLAFPGSNVASFALTAGLIGGNGLVNNAPFSFSTANSGDQGAQGDQFTGAYNKGRANPIRGSKNTLIFQMEVFKVYSELLVQRVQMLLQL